ncbi:hypothetical protein MMC10_003009 [Thelotrema lepadinum]|nr:hypothetical protein [Thelotrema lepadinum]
MEATMNAVAKAKPLVGTALEAGGNVIKNNPKIATIVASTGVGALTFSGLLIPALGAVGLAATGPVAGSLAAGYQSSVGAVAAGSVFANLQGAAMGGVALPGVQAGVAAIGGAVGYGVGGITNLIVNRAV